MEHKCAEPINKEVVVENNITVRTEETSIDGFWKIRPRQSPCDVSY